MLQNVYLLKRKRLCDQLQHFGTLRGADAITDHGAEYVVIAQRIPTTIFLWPVVPIFFFSPAVSRQWELRPKGSVVFSSFSRELFVRCEKKSSVLF